MQKSKELGATQLQAGGLTVMSESTRVTRVSSYPSLVVHISQSRPIIFSDAPSPSAPSAQLQIQAKDWLHQLSILIRNGSSLRQSSQALTAFISTAAAL